MSSAAPGRGCSGRAKVTVVFARRLRPRPLGITSAVPSMWTGMIGAPAVSASSATPCAVALGAGAAGALREEQDVAAVAQVRGRRGEAAALAAAAVEREGVDPEARGDRVAALAVEAVAGGADDGARAPGVREREQHERRVDVALVVGREDRGLRRVDQVLGADHGRLRERARGREQQRLLGDLAHAARGAARAATAGPRRRGRPTGPCPR